MNTTRAPARRDAPHINPLSSFVVALCTTSPHAATGHDLRLLVSIHNGVSGLAGEIPDAAERLRRVEGRLVRSLARIGVHFV